MTTAIHALLNFSPFMAIALAQIDAGAHPVLLTYGPLGVMCGWFMLRGEALIKEVRGYGHKIDGLRLAILAQAATASANNPSLRSMLEQEIARINAAEDGKK